MNCILRKYALLIVILLWSVFLLIIEFLGYEPYIELINIILGTLLAGIASYNSLTNSNGKIIFSIIIGLINIVLGILFIIMNFSLIHSTILLLIGGQLIGISIGKAQKNQKSAFLSTSTKRPEPIGPEPEPEPSPF